MPLVEIYALFAAVIAGSALLITLVAVALGSLGSRVRWGLVGLWLLLHAAALLSGAGGHVLGTVFVLGSSAGGAAILAPTVRTRGSLVALAVTASVVDMVSFSYGPTRWLLDSESSGVSTALRYLAVSMPFDGSVVLVVGLGDLLLFGTLFLGLRMQGHRPWVSALVLLAGLWTALAVGLARGGAFGIPFMAAGVILLSLRGRRTSRNRHAGKQLTRP